MARPDLKDIEAATERIKDCVLRSPTVPLNYQDGINTRIYLKLENLQPIGSFKLRGACNAVSLLGESELANGVLTASAGNFAQGLAWNTQQRGLPCKVVVPDHAPKTKLQAITELGGTIRKVPYDTWWRVVNEKKLHGEDGHFIHPVLDKAVQAGNGTIGLEILEDVPDVDAVIVPYGGGALCTGIATAVKGKKPGTKVFACEVQGAAPLKAAFNASQVVECDYVPSFVDGIGSRSVLPEMWPIVKHLLDDSLVVSLKQVADAIRLLVQRNHVVAEGAGAATIAAALSGQAGKGNIVCVISGGNLDNKDLIQILQGSIPTR